MNEKTKAVGEKALIDYDLLIKDWFTEKINEIDFVKPIYHEDTRILEFANTAQSIEVVNND